MKIEQEPKFQPMMASYSNSVPLIDMLRCVPKDARAIIETEDRFKESHSIPWGNMCHEAANKIEQSERELSAANTKLLEQEAVIAQMREALKDATAKWESMHGFDKFGIAKWIRQMLIDHKADIASPSSALEAALRKAKRVVLEEAVSLCEDMSTYTGYDCADMIRRMIAELDKEQG